MNQPPRSAELRWLIEHFQAYRKRRPWDFCWRITLEGLVVSMVPALFAWLLRLPQPNVDMTRGEFLVIGVVEAPIVETLLFQALPIGRFRALKASFTSQLILSTGLFAVAHSIFNGIVNGVSAGLIGGFYLAFTYAHWRDHSRWTAFWTTALSHAMVNAVGLLLGIATGEL